MDGASGQSVGTWLGNRDADTDVQGPDERIRYDRPGQAPNGHEGAPVVGSEEPSYAWRRAEAWQNGLSAPADAISLILPDHLAARRADIHGTRGRWAPAHDVDVGTPRRWRLTTEGVAMGLSQTAALVTGGASGIGRAVVELFAELGAHVVVADIDDDRGARIAREAIPALLAWPGEEACSQLVNG